MQVFGPVPSRRFGRSLGINNIPPKTCDYACAYCQIGRTTNMTATRATWIPSLALCEELHAKVHDVTTAGEAIDYLALVPDGEPTLDISIGSIITCAKELGYPVAVITNGSLLWNKDVRRALQGASTVSVKIDAVDEGIWKKINRPHPSLDLDTVLKGITSFSSEFEGKLITETMLVKGINDSAAHLGDVAAFIGKLPVDTAYISVPTRPPAEQWVAPPDESAVVNAYAIFAEATYRTELLTGYEGDAFSSTGDVAQDILSITSVHPMREAAVRKLVEGTNSQWRVVEDLVEKGELCSHQYKGHTYYVRSFKGTLK